MCKLGGGYFLCRAESYIYGSGGLLNIVLWTGRLTVSAALIWPAVPRASESLREEVRGRWRVQAFP